ncbi:MAG: hypothetical protein OdinLCB4_006205 [Candidatus Odinarchaeum yellowstonii]|jgi:hypothetical protein|uniref:Uncharacterized protein n=1 Tax=Odinarchaeota yellowstonii (strain LCB_4) TaxID=1841599 RepID=A0AAF0IB66_ODILC|nr:MAG: hypothetical protein OdinLCB4_006205 [Candidatus Odinarchaeum yellowstonii]
MAGESSIISNIMDIPGSSFRIQLEKKTNSALIRILRGLKITKEVEIPIDDLTKNRVVTIIQSELFMPISPFKIMKIVEELFKDIEVKEKSASSTSQLPEAAQPASAQEAVLNPAPEKDSDISKTC